MSVPASVSHLSRITVREYSEGRESDFTEGRRDALIIILQTKGEVSDVFFDKIKLQSYLEVMDMGRIIYR